ncbi:MAG: beta-lactamase family protein [Paludibacteraceae bacterium]|nr:beta-lactamase family protein [Paludibacteraceae bacterium]
MKTRISFIVFAFFLLFVGCGSRPAGSQGVEAVYDCSVLDSIVMSSVANGDVPGAVLCVSTPKGCYAKAYGWRGVFGRREEMPDSAVETALFDLASLSKPVGVGMAVLRLVEEGRICLSDKVSRYLPAYEGEATITDLLTHTSGLPAYAQWKKVSGSNSPNMLINDVERQARRQAMEDYVCHCTRLSVPASASGSNSCDSCWKEGVYRYSCLNFITLQYVVEAVTGMPLDDYTRRYVFEPLGMMNTRYMRVSDEWNSEESQFVLKPQVSQDVVVVPTEAVPVSEVSSSWLQTQGSDLFLLHDSVCLCGVVHDPLAREMNSGASGNAGVFSTAADLLALGEWMVGRRHVADTVMTDVQQHGLFFVVPEEYESFCRSLGWGVWTPDDSSCTQQPCPSDALAIIYHTGYTGTYMLVDKNRQLVLVLLTNRVHPHDGGAIGRMRKELTNEVLRS